MAGSAETLPRIESMVREDEAIVRWERQYGHSFLLRSQERSPAVRSPEGRAGWLHQKEKDICRGAPLSQRPLRPRGP